MKISKTLICMFCILFFPHMAASQTIRLGTEGAYAPFNFINDEGELDGLEREFGDEMCRRADLTCEWVINAWDTMIPNLVSANFDAIVASMGITDERDQVIDFTQDYIPADPGIYIALAGKKDAAIKGKIAAQKNTLHAAHVVETGATLAEFATPDETLAALENGIVDSVFASRGFLLPVVEGSGGELVVVGEHVVIGKGVGMGVRESDPELLEKFNMAISTMKEDGTINSLIDKWLDKNAPKY